MSFAVYVCSIGCGCCKQKKINLEDDSVLHEMDFLDLTRYSSYIIGVKLTNL